MIRLGTQELSARGIMKLWLKERGKSQSRAYFTRKKA
jgi:hypothetical protein